MDTTAGLQRAPAGHGARGSGSPDGKPGSGWPFGLSSSTPAERQELLFLSNNPRTAQTEGEGCVLEQGMAEVRAAGDFGNRPLYVLSGSRRFRAPSRQY